jgi:hypothetical protein
MAGERPGAWCRDPARSRAVNEDYELRDWSKKFGMSQDELKAAGKAGGDKATAVEKHLKGKRAA